MKRVKAGRRHRRRVLECPVTETRHRAHIHPRWLRPLAEPGTCSWWGGYTPDGRPCLRKMNNGRCNAHRCRVALHKVPA